MVIFLFRPSPQVPHPSARAARLCFEASRSNIHVQKEQIDNKSADTTWIFTQQLFMAINTVLWALSYAEICEEHPRIEVEKDLHMALEAIWWASKRWPGVESALELYTTLVQACLKAYDGDTNASYGVSSPVHQAHAASPQSFDTPPPLSTPSTIYSNVAPTQYTSPNESHQSPQSYFAESEANPSIQELLPQASMIAYPGVSHASVQRQMLPESTPNYTSNIPAFDPGSLRNPLPPPIEYSYGQTAAESSMLSLLAHDKSFFMGSLSDQYAPLYQYMPMEPLDGLNLEQQSELMNTLELYGLNGPPPESSPVFARNDVYSA